MLALNMKFLAGSSRIAAVAAAASVACLCAAYPLPASAVALPSTNVFLTSTGAHSWTVPSDWNSANNKIEVIGGGGNGATDNNGGGGGGGGGYSAVTNVALTPGASVNYSIGSASGDT